MTTPRPSPATRSGWLDGLLGVVIFSGSLPATRIAVLALDPFFVTFARAAVAGGAAVVVLCAARERVPTRGQAVPVSIVAAGVVIGFPLLTALALRAMTSAHALVFVGLLPLSTALFGVVRGGERPRAAFWLFSVAGGVLVAGYASGGAMPGGSPTGDALMLAAIFVCGLGYAEGGRLSRDLGGWQVISWALVLALPVTLPLAVATAPASWAGVGWPVLVALLYVSMFSMLIGFVFWYRGLARGGIAAVGQLQLLQPFFGLALAALILHETVGWPVLGVAAGVAACVAGARRFR